MDIQKTLTNAGRKLAPGLAATYDVLKNAQDTYNDMRHYNQYKTRERINSDIVDRINKKIQDRENSAYKNYEMYYDLYPDDTNDLRAKTLDRKHLANSYYERYLADEAEANRLRGKLPANNTELFNMVASAPTTNPIANVDVSKTRNNLLNRQIDLIATEQAILDNYWSDKEGTDFTHKRFLKQTQDEWDRNKKTLEDLGFDMDYLGAEYYRRYPTRQMLGVQELAGRLDNWMKNKLGVNDNTQAEENEQAKRLVTNELKRMNAAGELTKDISRTKKLIDLYKKLK